MTFEGNEGQNKGQRSDIWSQEHGAERGEAELRIFNLSSDKDNNEAFWHLPDWSQAVVR